MPPGLFRWLCRNVVFAALAMMVFVCFSKQFMGMFTDDAAVLMTAQSLIFPLALYQLGDATQVTFANALRGTSHVMPMLWIAFVSYVVVGYSIPLQYGSIWHRVEFFNLIIPGGWIIPAFLFKIDKTCHTGHHTLDLSIWRHGKNALTLRL